MPIRFVDLAKVLIESAQKCSSKGSKPHPQKAPSKPWVVHMMFVETSLMPVQEVLFP